MSQPTHVFQLQVGEHRFTVSQRPRLNLVYNSRVTLTEFGKREDNLAEELDQYASEVDAYRRVQIWAASDMGKPELANVPTFAFMAMLTVLSQECIDWLWETNQHGTVKNPSSYPTLNSLVDGSEPTQADAYRYLSTHRRYTKAVMNTMFNRGE